MFSFSGIAQIKERIPDSFKSYGKTTFLKFKIVCGRGQSVPYDGENPFDIYELSVSFLNDQSHKLEKLQPGVIIWVENGKVTSYCNVSYDKEWWTPALGAPIDQVKVIMDLPLGPSHQDHMRSSSNSRKYNK